MEKTAKITRTVFKNIWNNPKGGQIFYHEIELDNGDSGQIGCKEQTPAKINPGNSLTYTIEADGRGGQKIKAVIPVQQSGGHWPKGNKPQVAPQVQMIGYAMSYCKDLIIAGKADMKDLGSTFEIIYSEMISKIKE
jgi:hypothetical protein